MKKWQPKFTHFKTHPTICFFEISKLKYTFNTFNTINPLMAKYSATLCSSLDLPL